MYGEKKTTTFLRFVLIFQISHFFGRFPDGKGSNRTSEMCKLRDPGHRRVIWLPFVDRNYNNLRPSQLARYHANRNSQESRLASTTSKSVMPKINPRYAIIPGVDKKSAPTRYTPRLGSSPNGGIFV